MIDHFHPTLSFPIRTREASPSVQHTPLSPATSKQDACIFDLWVVRDPGALVRSHQQHQQDGLAEEAHIKQRTNAAIDRRTRSFDRALFRWPRTGPLPSPTVAVQLTAAPTPSCCC
uniref:Uncharacterized protein n=1 Tax=Steinernema glaseri TaxID=37863 RepID=A0A1I8A3L5_9BILA